MQVIQKGEGPSASGLEKDRVSLPRFSKDRAATISCFDA